MSNSRDLECFPDPPKPDCDPIINVPIALPKLKAVCEPGEPIGDSGDVEVTIETEAYPTSVSTSQILGNFGSTLNEVTSLFALTDESGLCSETSFWDPALNRFTIQRAGRYQVNWALFMRLVIANNTAGSNNSIYGGMRFVRPAGTVDGRTVSSVATTLRGTQFSIGLSGSPTTVQDFTSVGAHTFVATAGTQLSLRAVAILGVGSSIGPGTFVVRGDSGHFSLAQLPNREF